MVFNSATVISWLVSYDIELKYPRLYSFSFFVF